MTQNSLIKGLSEKIINYKGKTIRIMEVCGTHTHENFRLGIRALLPPDIKLISGPGCPVCVTPVSYIDEAIEIAKKGAVVCSFGDLLRVPGSDGSLSDLRALGADIKVVYSPLDALRIAKENSSKEVVFLSVGFETTTPITCSAVKKAYIENVGNFSLLTSNKTMPNVYEKLSDCADVFLYPGHVSAISGTILYEELKGRGISGVVAGFTALELLSALVAIIKNSAKKKPFFMNCYPRVVSAGGNSAARDITDEIMEQSDAVWRGLGNIENSGLKIREKYSSMDARLRYKIGSTQNKEPSGCRCGDVLCGKIEPKECPLFERYCTPEKPCGACMVSGEGACAAYYKYGEM
ncbi:MAG TPA: hydrogenase formation protein HypD [Ruminiclostridium sp.]|nr:hydrogenase formation protein HypD [Ruminiclostridium sp.]